MYSCWILCLQNIPSSPQVLLQRQPCSWTRGLKILRLALGAVKTQTLGPTLRVQEVWGLATEFAFLTSSQLILMLLAVLGDPLWESQWITLILISRSLTSRFKAATDTRNLTAHYSFFCPAFFAMFYFDPSLIVFLCLFADFSHLINRSHLQLHVHFLREFLLSHCLGHLIGMGGRLSNKHHFISKAVSSGWCDNCTCTHHCSWTLWY